MDIDTLTDEEFLDTAGPSEDHISMSLTDWVNPPKVKDLKQDYEDAQSDHDIHTMDVDRWINALNITGEAKREKIDGKSGIQPRLIRKQAEWRYAALSEPFLSTEDVFNVEPVTFEDKKAAIQNGLVLNNQFNNKLKKVVFFDEYVRTCVDEGTVIVRTGWKFEEEEVEVPDMQPQLIQDPAMAQQIMQVIQQMQQLAQQAQQDPQAQQQMQQMQEQMDPTLMQNVQLSVQAGQPVQLVEVGTKLEMQTTANHPTLEVCDYHNVLIDPTAEGNIDNAGFVIYSFSSDLSSLKKDGKYSNLDSIKVEDSNVLSSADHQVDETSSFNFSDKPRKKIAVYEYWGNWDIDGSGIVKPIVAAWVGDVMIRLEDNPYPDKKPPFVSAQYLPVRKSNYGEPDGELLKENQDVIGAVTRGMIDIMGRSANGQQVIVKGAFDVTNKRKYDRGEDCEINPTVDAKQAVQMITFPEIPQSAGLMLQLQNNEAESMSGVKAFSGTGITGQALGETATGVRSALDAVSKRELGILRRLADGVKQIGRKMIAMNAEFLSEEEVIRITNEEFVTVRRDDLAGNIDLTLTISTAESDNDKAQELAFMLQTTGQTMGPEFSQIILSDIARLRKMPELAKKIEAYQPPPPDPLEVKAKELEVKKLEMEIAKLESETAENYANAALDNAKARTETSMADKTDLDFVEQEGGVTQERELEKAKAQSQGNMALKAMESGLKLREKSMDNQSTRQDNADKHAYNLREKAADALIESAKPAEKK